MPPTSSVRFRFCLFGKYEFYTLLTTDKKGVAEERRQILTIKFKNMILTEEQKKDFEKVSKPLIKFLAENFHPHVTVIVENNRAEILEGSASVITNEFIED